MSIQLAEEAVHALNRAAAAAARDGAATVEPRHVLAGVLSHGEPALLRVADRLGLEFDDLPDGFADLPVTHENHIPFSASSHEALAAAVEFSSTHGPEATNGVHLLLGVAGVGDPESDRVLADWGLEEPALRRELARKPTTTLDGAGAADADASDRGADSSARAPQ